MSVSDRKSELRKTLLPKRKSMSVDVWKQKSIQILDNLTSMDKFRSATVIHSFVSMNDRREVNTHSLIKDLIAGNKSVIIPVTDFETGELQHSELNSFNDLKPNKWGVLEPLNFNPTDIRPDCILVPLLAADKQFNRLGYGKGFYDRFLESTQAVKIGLLFEDYLFDEIPIEDFDEKLDILITEKKILRRNKSYLDS